MNTNTLFALIGKDLRLHYRNRFILVITVLSVAIFCILYFVLPDTMDETYEIGIVGDVPDNILELIGEEDEGIALLRFAGPEELKNSIDEGEIFAGIRFPDKWITSLRAGEKPELELYFASDTPDEMVEIVRLLLSELAFEISGKTLQNIRWEGSFIGEDMSGEQIPYRERMRPLIAIVILFMETFGLASLISEEVERRTAEALLITPLTVPSFFTAKAILGTLLAFVQAAVVMLVVGGLTGGPLIILTTLLLGAIMITAVSFIMASAGKDFISVVAYGMPVFILLIIPGFSAVIPGAAAPWVRYIPSWFLTDTIVRVSQAGAGWSEVGRNLLILLGANVILIAAGILSLRRKLA